MTRRVGEKAWRFSGEMSETASSIKDSELPAGFHDSVSLLDITWIMGV